MRRIVVEIMLLCCITLAISCDKAWQAYEDIEIGSPVPAENLLSREGQTEGHVTAWDEDATINFPAIGAGLSLRVLTDDAGNVIAKRYDAAAIGHWLLCQTVAVRYVVEVQVPENAFHDPPADGLSYKWSLPSSPDQCTNVAEYLIFVDRQATRVRFRHSNDFNVLDQMTWNLFFGSYMYSHGKAPMLSDLVEIVSVFDGVTKDGFDRRYTNKYGETCRIQNLGDRRIRIESGWFRIFDPFILLVYLEFSRVETQVTI